MRARAAGVLLAAASTLLAACGGGEPRADASTREPEPELPASASAVASAGLEAAATAAEPAPQAASPTPRAPSPTPPPPEPLAMALPADSEDLHPAELLTRVSLPTMRLGRPLGESVLEAQFEADPSLRPDDPEADAVTRGRRLVPVIEGELARSFDTPEALAEALLDAIERESLDMFEELRIDRAEFERFFWPEFPQSRPITNATAADAWLFHNGHCRDGVLEMLDGLSGRRLHLQGLRYREGVARYRNFNLYHGVVIEAATAEGDLVEIDEATVFAERNGRWKVYIFDS
ncbi:MAG: hypothetical protein ACT4PE_02510 [Candidatus Eiseniibacteriota bacterium]